MLSVRDITTAIASSAGDAAACAEALATLYDQKFDFVYCLVRARTGVDESTALDIVQDTMIRVIKHMKPLPNEAALDAWLARVALTTACDHFRRERRRRTRERGASMRSPDLCERSSQEIEALRREIAGLDEGSFDLLTLRFRAGMTLERIGARLGIGPGAVDGRVRRMLARLRDRIREESDG